MWYQDALFCCHYNKSGSQVETKEDFYDLTVKEAKMLHTP